MFHMDVAKVDPDVAYVATSIYICCKASVENDSSVSDSCCKCFILDVRIFYTYVASVCSKCFSYFRRMLH